MVATASGWCKLGSFQECTGDCEILRGGWLEQEGLELEPEMGQGFFQDVLAATNLAGLGGGFSGDAPVAIILVAGLEF